jgi:hemerythrin
MRTPTWTITWNDEMSVGIPAIDEDHRRFIEMINDLNRAITERVAPAEIKRRLQRIVDDAKLHFVHEEKLFFEWDYPDVGSHTTTHANILRALLEMEKDFVPYGLDSGWINAGLRVKELLISHVLNEDMKYAEYYRSSRKADASEKV